MHKRAKMAAHVLPDVFMTVKLFLTQQAHKGGRKPNLQIHVHMHTHTCAHMHVHALAAKLNGHDSESYCK